VTRLPPSPRLPEQIADFLGSARFSSALTLAILGTVLLAHPARALVGWPALIAALATLVVLAALSLIAKRGDYEWRGLLPISLLVFVGWCALTVLWSRYQWITVGGVLYQLTVMFLGVYVAIARDLIQIVRAMGDVLRLILIASISLEVLAGLLIDMPLPFLGIQGNLDVGGPIQGILGGRNALGTVALIAAITFAVEYYTRSVRRGRALGSFVAAAIVVALTRSPVIGGTLLVLAAATLALLGLRRTHLESRRAWQVALLALGLVGAGIVTALRGQLIVALNAQGEFELRAELWRELLRLGGLNQFEGWGWLGWWRQDIIPYVFLADRGAVDTNSALSSFVDLYFQTGVVGLVIFLCFAGLAFGRSWLLASDKRSVSYLWTPLVLVVLGVVSLAESVTIVEWGWLLLVICAIKAAQDKSWRGTVLG
jgi:exopolysaccharide production protein ExoQ